MLTPVTLRPVLAKLVKVTVCGELLVPTVWLENVITVGERLTAVPEPVSVTV